MLNKVELLLWDTWGWMEYDFQPSEKQLEQLDGLAALTQGGDAAFEEICALYADERFRAPVSLMSYSPTGNFQRVDVGVFVGVPELG